MKVAIIGLGQMGQIRLKALKQLQEEGLDVSISVLDPYISKENRDNSVQWFESLTDLKFSIPNFVIIATPPDVSFDISKEIIRWNNCQLLVEFPFGRTYPEARQLHLLARSGDQVFVGSPHRFQKGVSQLVTDTLDGKFGDVISVKMIMNQAGNEVDKKTWKYNSYRAGGGTFLNYGSIFIDLLTQIFDDIVPVSGSNWKGYWKTGIDEEFYLHLKDGKININLEASMVKWQNEFRIEVSGTEGLGVVIGNKIQKYLRYNKEKKISEITTDASNCYRDELDAIFSKSDKYQLLPCSSLNNYENMNLYHNCTKVIE